MKTSSSHVQVIAASGMLALLITAFVMPAYAVPPATIPQHYPNIRVALEAYQGPPLSAFDTQLLQNSVDLVSPSNGLIGPISQVAPNTPQFIYSNVSSIYENLLSSWLNYADANGVSRESAFYHAAVPIAYSGASPSSTPANNFWAVY